MSVRARSDRWVIGGIVLLALVAICALVVPSGDGVAAPTAPPSNTAEPTISGRAERGRTLTASRGTWTGTGPISYAYQWLRCGADGGRADGGDCAIVSGATRRDHRLGSGDVGFRIRVRVTATNAEGSRVAASNPTATVVGPPVNTAPPFPRGSTVVGQVVTGEPGTWTGASPDLVLVPVAAVQLGRRRVRVDRRWELAELPGQSERRRPEAPIQRDGAELAGHGHRDLDGVRSRDGAPAIRGDPPAERGVLDSRCERAVQPPPDRLPGAVRAEPGDRAQPGAHRARAREGHAWIRDPRRTRLRALDSARHDGWRPPGDDHRRLGDLPARSERELPEAAARLQRPVLREGRIARATLPSAASPATASSRCGSLDRDL